MVRKKMTYNTCIHLAYKSALKSNMKYKHGCVIVSHNNIFISKGYNISYNRMEHGVWSLHAEVNAIEHAIRMYGKKILESAKLYVVRIDPFNDLRMSKPCNNCEKCIEKYKIAIAYYSIS